MPLFDFVCTKCGHPFEGLVRRIGRDMPCPRCGYSAVKLPGAPSMIVGPTLHTDMQKPQPWRDAKERAEHGFRHVGAKRP